MSKKQKRQVPRSAAPIVHEPLVSSGNGNGHSAAASPSIRPSAGRSSIVDFNPDYSYVINDLKRIATLAGSFIVILVALSFFLR